MDKLLLAAKLLYKDRIESLCGEEGIWLTEEEMLADNTSGHLWKALKEAIEEKELEL